MSKEKLKSLSKYQDGVKNKLTSPTPSKHQKHPEQYRQFLQRELDAVNRSIEELKAVPTK
jgi:hypothetical protein